MARSRNRRIIAEHFASDRVLHFRLRDGARESGLTFSSYCYWVLYATQEWMCGMRHNDAMVWLAQLLPEDKRDEFRAAVERTLDEPAADDLPW
jgi:hypothetical protein